MGSSAAKVGLFVVVALAMMAGIYLWLQGELLGKPTITIQVEFENAMGIDKGTMVRMSGVKIGEVTDIHLDPVTRRARVMLKVKEDSAPQATDKITIATGGLLPQPYIEIIPVRPPIVKTTGVFRGTEATTLDQLLPKADSLMTEMTTLTQSLQQVSRSVNSFIGDPEVARDLKAATANLAATSARGQQIAANLERVSARAPTIMAGFERTGRSAEATMAAVQGTVAENRGRLTALLDQAAQSMEAMEQTLMEARSLIADEQSKENLRETLVNVREATATMKEAAATLRQTAGDVQSLTGDPKVQEDLRETLAGARATMGQAAELLQRVNQIVGPRGGGNAAGVRQRFRDTELRLDVQQTTSPGQPRVDVNATIPGRSGRFARLGVQDLGESTGLNLELGRPLQDGLWLRYGMHASRLGLGVDWGGARGSLMRPRLSADLYGLDEPAFDVRGALPLRPNLDLTFGLDRLFDDNAPAVGLRWHK